MALWGWCIKEKRQIKRGSDGGKEKDDKIMVVFSPFFLL
jgi:hypothetical protein